MLELWKKLFSWQEFIPHGHCYLWKPGLVWLHIISDTVIGIAYYSIPVVLIYFVRKRQDLPFNGIFFLFSSFIVACGTTHLLEIWTLWQPIYWFSGLLKAITAVVSLYTAITLVLLVPKALAIPSQVQLEKVNSELQQQIRERCQVEQALQKANEELFHKNQQRLELAHKIARIGTFEWNIQSNLVIWTEELEVLYGLPIGSFGGRFEHWAQLVHSDDLARIEQEIQCAIHEHKELDTEYRIIWADGSQHWIAAKAQVFGDRTEKPSRMIGINMDISERKQAEQKIREQAALLDVTQDAIVVHSVNEDKILFWNKGAESVYGWKAQQAIAKNASILLYDDEQTLHTLNTAKETVLLKGGWHGELHQFTQDNKEIIVSSRWTLLNNWFDHTTAILSVNTDITDKKTLEAQFFRAQRLESIGTLASGIAHDLNNVLTPIMTSVQLLLSTKLSAEKTQKLLTIVESSSKRGSALVKQVLQFARGFDTQLTMVPLRDLLQELEQITVETFPKSISVRMNISPDIGLVLGDGTQLQQVLMNLCVNARDAMPNGGLLTISADSLLVDENFVSMNPDARIGNYVVITILDTGIGIPPKIIDKIFEPFFTTKEVGKGTGLGLFTVFGIVKNHNGFIKVYSEVGRGTQFKIYLPILDGSVAQPLEDVELRSGNGELVLFVDDESAIQEISKSLLLAHNYRVLTAKDGIEALAVYVESQQQIDIVVMDLMMPSLDGTTTIRTLRKINPHIKIVAISGIESNKSIAQQPDSLVHAFLCKPYTMQEFLKTLSSVLSL